MHTLNSHDFSVSPEAATEQAHLALEEGFRYDRPFHLYENGWRYLESAQWLVEHVLRGTHSLVDEDLPIQLFSLGVADLKRSAEKADHQTYHKFINTLLSHRVLRWMCDERRSSNITLVELQDAYLQDIATSLSLRHGRLQKELRDKKLTEKQKNSRMTDYGFLFEAVILGIVAESERFRDARIIGLPASPTYESTSAGLPLPPDILLWKIGEDKSATPIGGIQAKSRHKGTATDPQAFTATFLARNDYFPGTIQDSVADWLSGNGLEQTHYRLNKAIIRSGNVALMGALNLEQ